MHRAGSVQILEVRPDPSFKAPEKALAHKYPRKEALELCLTRVLDRDTDAVDAETGAVLAQYRAGAIPEGAATRLAEENKAFFDDSTTKVRGKDMASDSRGTPTTWASESLCAQM